MSGLDQETRAFLDEALRSDRPRLADRARIRAGIEAQLAPPPAAPVAPSAGAAAPRLMGLKLGALAVLIGGAVALYGRADSPPQAGAPPASLAAPQETPPPAEEAPPPPQEASADGLLLEPTDPGAALEGAPPAPSAPSAVPDRGASLALSPGPRRRPARAAGEGSEGLGAEARLLAAARVALREGDFAAALARARAHGAQFPRGALRAERWAAEAMALCGLGRAPEARQLRRALAEHAPESPLLSRVDERCHFGMPSD